MKALTRKKYLLEKFPGKGGWTFVRIPEIRQDKTNPFGWVKVKGMIDGYKLHRYKLMPMGNGHVFLPVKAAIRKIIGKEAGDYVLITLFPDNDPIFIPDELLDCLKDEPIAYKNFMGFSEAEKHMYIHWIYNTKKESTRIERMAIAITNIAKGLIHTKTITEPS